ncbi:MAG: Mini-ribonuclease 3 [Peptococcaceae bacterium]|nr:Mini-ribonuclease 3 [Peptococcaceae bacterium]
MNPTQKDMTLNENPREFHGKPSELPVLTLAYIGDAVYEIWVRTYLIKKGLVRADELHHAAVRLVQAKGQAALMKRLLPDLDEDEQAVFRRGRNAKGQHPRHADVLAYRHATGLEALIGYLHMSDQQERLAAVFAKINHIIEVNEEPGVGTDGQPIGKDEEKETEERGRVL